MAALSWYTRARRELPPEEREGTREKIVTLLDQDLDADTYKEIEIVYRDTFIARFARYKLAQLFFHKGNFKEASDLLRETLEESSGEAFYPLMEDLWRKIQKSVKKEVVLGCILPLQGRAKPFGIKALQGIKLAMGAFRPQQWPFKVRLIIWDSGGKPARAKEGVKALASQGVVAIIGPLLSHTSIAAATEAEALKVPLITLSPLIGIAKKGRYIFQNSLTYSSQVKALVKYAFDELGIITYATLYPRNSYGMTFKKLFEQEVESYGGTLVVAASYNDEQTDFGDVIKEMVEYLPKKDPEEEPKPIINFGAIFIPDDFKKIRLIVPQLAYYNITNVQLLGTNGWDSPELVRGGGEFFEGAIFVDSFFKDSPVPWIRNFVRDFEGTFSLSPTLLEALSFDSTDIILKVISNQNLGSREALNESLLSLKEYIGVTGLIGFNQDGEAVRKLLLLTVSHGMIHQISQTE
jgi:branched-chain amino acid transport system substrate-binding protein